MPDKYHSIKDIKKAVAGLSEHDLLWVYRYAVFRATIHPTLETSDLVHEAILRTLDGRRRWSKSVPLQVHLMSTVKSIASSAAKSPVGEPVAEHADRLESPAHGEEQLIFSRTVNQVREVLSNDEEALTVVDLMFQGWSGPEIQRSLGMSQRAFQTIVRRAKRRVSRALLATKTSGLEHGS